jgi:hypothetical protein
VGLTLIDFYNKQNPDFERKEQLICQRRQ